MDEVTREIEKAKAHLGQALLLAKRRGLEEAARDVELMGDVVGLLAGRCGAELVKEPPRERTRIEAVVVVALALLMGAVTFLCFATGTLADAAGSPLSPLSPVPTPQVCPVVYECGDWLCVWSAGEAIPLFFFDEDDQAFLEACWGAGLGAAPDDWWPR